MTDSGEAETSWDESPRKWAAEKSTVLVWSQARDSSGPCFGLQRFCVFVPLRNPSGAGPGRKPLFSFLDNPFRVSLAEVRGAAPGAQFPFL
jgi:hypothetical protein